MADTRIGKIGLTPKGAWAQDDSYEILDVVLYAVEDGGDGCSYTALKPSQGVRPDSDSTIWLKSSQAGQSIYDLAVKYKHFEGTEEEFEAEYQAVLQAARAAAAGASAVESAVEAAEMQRMAAESARVSAESERASAETARHNAETSRATAETARQTAESNRDSAETTRQSAETTRESAETTRRSNESARESAELTRTQQFQALKTDMQTAIQNVDAKAAEIAEDIEGYEQNEAGRVSAEQGRVAAETARETAESARQSAEQGRQNAETERQTAEGNRATAETARASAEEARATAEQGRVSAESNRVSAEQSRAAAETARESASATAVQNAEEATEAANTAAEAAGALQESLESGAVIPKLAEDLASWNDEALMQDDMQALPVFTTGGDISIKSSVPAQLTEIAAKTDFSASALRASGFNLLRLKSNDGLAVAVGSGFYFPVPALHFGTINTAEQPNGVLFTNSAGENLRPTVYFKKASAGVPISVTDGAPCSYVDAPWGGGTLRFFTTSEPGWLIVSGITWADTCAHIGWSKRYDGFISPTNESDAGHSVDLSATIAAMHPFGKMLTVGSSADRIRRISAEQVQWETECDRVQPAWTNTLQEDGETYLHTATISAMKSDGAAQFETAAQALTISGTSISYTDSSESALTDYVKYEKATVATGVRTLASDFNVEDWGLIVLLDAVGEAYTTIAYAQGIPDNVRALVSARLSGQMSVVAQAFAELYAEHSALLDALSGSGGIHRIGIPVVDAQEYRRYGFIEEITGDGAPSADVVPVDWEKNHPGVMWTGIPLAPGMMYFDSTNNKWYKAKPVLTGSVADWVMLN